MTDLETPTPVIFRKDKENGSIIAFILDCPANLGCIIYLDRISGHGEADLDYYWNNTVPASSEEYAEMKHWMESAYHYVIKLRHRIVNKDLDLIWRTIR